MNKIRRKLHSLKEYLRFSRACIFSSNTIIHIGFPYEKEKLTYNIGDTILYVELEEMFDFISKKKHSWIHLQTGIKLNSMRLFIINMFTKGIIIGGHGLMMSDHCYENSGWMFNISLSNLRKVRVPMIFFAIGYNPFRKQKDFLPIFNTHIEECIKISKFFGLRNFGSIECIKNV